MTRIIFYIPEKAINDATEYYVNLVKKAFMEKGVEVVVYNYDNFDLKTSHYFFTIRVRDFIQIYKKKRSAKIIMWFQGLGPEEYLMLNDYSLKAYITAFIFNLVEKITIKKSYYNLFVSKKMEVYFRKKHSYNKSNYSIIPCYNKKLVKKYFEAALKPQGSFVYAGSLYAWQCFDKTIALFKEIELKNSKVSLTILTQDIAQAHKEIKRHNIKSYSVAYVALQDLDRELSKFKYGFMLREDHIINNVATPTKMNSYLSVGLIPIYSDVIHSFTENLDLDPYEIKTKAHESLSQLAERIITHNATEIDYDAFYKTCLKNFSSYYNDDLNVNKIKNELVENFILESSKN